ncbi:hypothetical protein B0H21DRAFT_462975 [Amylocystis lapponica]|nr:hypothetical protein B0H21DRAFT_462975 [Amylocystis lapponica]
MFDNVKKGMSEANIQSGFMEAITKKNILGDDYKAVSSPNRSDPSDASRQKPDAGVYPTSTAPTDERTHWATKRLSIEFKKEPTQDDPFDDDKDDKDKDKDNVDNDDPFNLFEATALKRQANRGQIIHSASEIFLRQHRCFLYSVIVLGTSARIIRWDRSGALVTTKFNYKEEPETICEFLWYFGRMSSKDQGYDPSVVPVTKGSDDYNLMDTKATEELPRDKDGNENVREYVRKYFERSLVDGWQRYKVEVPLNEDNEETYAKVYGRGAGNFPTTNADEKTGTFLICKPHFSAFGFVGRGTRGYVAIDCATRDFVFLKDAWRVDMPDIEREGDVLQTLNDTGVRNIPTVLCHGDILAQRTVTQDFSHHDSESWLSQRSGQFKPHRHYRLVEKEVGQALEDFCGSRDLVLIVVDCLYAHSDAVEKAGILHRDISAGNLLMIKEKRRDGVIQYRGLLNDWELSKKIPVVDPPEDGPRSTARQPDRTGTWLFLSAASLNDKYKQMVLQDDLESFFHVLLYMAIRYLPSNCPDVENFIERFFEGAGITAGEYVCGEAKMSAMENGVIRINAARQQLRFYLPDEDSSNDTASPPDLPAYATAFSHETIRVRLAHPINDIFSTLLLWFSAYYEERRLEEEGRMCNENPFDVSTVQNSSTAEADDGYDSDPEVLDTDSDSETNEAKLPAEANLQHTKFAKKLSSHKFMKQLLRIVRKKLPNDDKVDVRAAQAEISTRRDHVVIPARPARTQGSSKRDYPEPGPEVDVPPLKRLRTSQAELLFPGIELPFSGSRHPAQPSGSNVAPSSLTRGVYTKAGPSKNRGSTRGSKGYSGRG